jgi:hypothetical protein
MECQQSADLSVARFTVAAKIIFTFEVGTKSSSLLAFTAHPSNHV